MFPPLSTFDSPVIVSPTTKSISLLDINFKFAAASRINAVAPEVPPVISSPFTNGPFVDGLSNDRVTLSPRVIEVPSTKVVRVVIIVCDMRSVTVILRW